MKTLDYFAPFAYLFREKGWLKKFVLASLLTCTLIGSTPILGWTIEILRRVAKNEETLIPDFTDWKTYWRVGGKFAFINAIWLLPVLLAVLLLYLPLIFVKAIQPEKLLVVFGVSLACVLVFLLLYSMFYIFLVPSMMIRLVETGSTWKAMNPIQLWKGLRPHFIEHLTVFLIVGMGLFNLVLLIAPFTAFLLLPSMLVYTSLVIAHYAGQLMQMG
jgi:hypothetical protein